MSPAGLHADEAEINKRPGGYRRTLLFSLSVLAKCRDRSSRTSGAHSTRCSARIVGQGLIFRHAYFLRCRVKALAGIGRLLNLGGKIRHEGYLLLHVLAGPQAAVGPGMSGNHALPAKGKSLVQRALPLGGIGVVHREPRRHGTE